MILEVGTVASFRGDRGDGIVVTPQGESLYFHCVEIADGTRVIDEGANVAFVRRVGLRGFDEASQLSRQ